MMQFQVLGVQLQAELFVFDKDGLLFDSEAFWKALAAARADHFTRLTGDEALSRQWLRAMGVELDLPQGGRVDPLGVLAAASVEEEIAVTAGFLAEHRNAAWSEARDMARNIFQSGDETLDLTQALKPMEGFPDIFKRLRRRQTPYGIATSDTYERAKTSIQLFDDWDAVQFTVTPEDVSRGKPDREMLDKISADTKVKPSDMVMLGDSYLDVAMAKSAGAIGIGVTKDPEMKKRMSRFTPWIVESLEQIVF